MEFTDLPRHVQISVNAVGGPDTPYGREMLERLTKNDTPVIEHKKPLVLDPQKVLAPPKVDVKPAEPEPPSIESILADAAAIK